MTEKEIDNQINGKPSEEKKEEWGELAKTLILALLLAGIIRTFLYEPFNIPSGSMKPTLLVGDYLFVSKTSYGYSQYSFPFGIAEFEGRIWQDTPKRGDVAVFKLPTDTSTDYIKRVIGIPGDKIQVIGGKLYINGKKVNRELVGYKQIEERNGKTKRVAEYIETLPNGVMHTIYEEDDIHPLDNTPEYIVPEGHYFMMGDNRDNSRDSRVQDHVGFVPLDNFVGRAEFIFFSTNGKARFFEFWKWPITIRYSRIFNSISPTALKE